MICARAASSWPKDGDHGGANLIADRIGFQATLADLFLGLPGRRIGEAAVIDRHGQLGHDGAGQDVVAIDLAVVALGDVPRTPSCGARAPASIFT